MTDRPALPARPTRPTGSPQPTPLFAAKRVLALAWVVGVVILYIAVRELALHLGL